MFAFLGLPYYALCLRGQNKCMLIFNSIELMFIWAISLSTLLNLHIFNPIELMLIWAFFFLQKKNLVIFLSTTGPQQVFQYSKLLYDFYLLSILYFRVK